MNNRVDVVDGTSSHVENYIFREFELSKLHDEFHTLCTA